MKMFGEEAQQRPVCLPFAKQTWEAIGLLERIQARTDHKTRLRNLAPGGFLSLHQCGRVGGWGRVFVVCVGVDSGRC